MNLIRKIKGTMRQVQLTTKQWVAICTPCHNDLYPDRKRR